MGGCAHISVHGVGGRGVNSRLGLAIAGRLVELHGGKLWVDDTDMDLGSQFHFTIPLAAEPKTRSFAE
jgi:signal transduction histidine kinase